MKRQRRCMITGTFTTVNELRQQSSTLQLRNLHSFLQRACQPPGTRTARQKRRCVITGTSTTWMNTPSTTASVVAHNGCATTCTANDDHLINVLQLESLFGKTKGTCICATTGMSTTRSLACGETLKTATSRNINGLLHVRCC